MTLRLNCALVGAEENETIININHHGKTFSIYTTSLKASRELERLLTSYYVLAPDGASATANDVPITFLTKLRFSRFR